MIDYVRFRVGVDSNFIFTRYLYDPVTVLATSKIDLLPYQIEDFLTLLDMAETGEVRVLLAYETGLGKTIVTGLFLKEMLLRDENQRVLILVPPNVRRQWKRELKEKFNLDFKVDFELDKSLDMLKEKWLIASMDTLKLEHWKKWIKDYGYRWDIVIVDELHRAKEGNQRAQLIQLVSARTKHFIALTATPHDGKEENFIFRLSLINPSVDESNYKDFVRQYVIRRIKREVTDLDGRRLFPQLPITRTVEIEPTPEEREFYRAVEEYIRHYYRLASQENNRAIGLVATVIGRTVSSSIRAGVAALKRRLNRLTMEAADIATETSQIDPDEVLGKLQEAMEEADDKTVEQLREEIINFIPPQLRDELKVEEERLKKLIGMGELIIQRERIDTKAKELLKIVDEHLGKGNKVIIFTEYLDTLFYLNEILGEKYGPERVTLIHGSMKPEEKDESVRKLWAEDGASILIATDAAGESLNLQAANVVINYEIPWNPVVYIQRIGRVYRYGQKKPVIFIYGILPVFKVERRVLEVVLDKINKIKTDFDLGSAEIVGEIISQKDIEKVIMETYANLLDMEEAREKISRDFEEKRRLLNKIKEALSKAKAVQKHVRLERLLKDKNVLELVTEQHVIRYLQYLRETGLVYGSIGGKFGHMWIDDREPNFDNIKLVNNKQVKAIWKRVQEASEIVRPNLDDPGAMKAILLGLGSEGVAAFLWEGETLYGEVRIATFTDGLGTVVNEIPVVVLENGDVKPVTWLKELEVFDEIDHDKVKELLQKQVDTKVAINSELIKCLRRDVHESVKNHATLLIGKYHSEIRKVSSDAKLDKYIRERKLKELREKVKQEMNRKRAVEVSFSEKPIGKVLLIGVNDANKFTLKKSSGESKPFDPELWKRKKEVELAAMAVVEWWEKHKLGRNPRDVSADGRGYDIESVGENHETFYVEVKGFKREPVKVELTENEYYAASYYKDKYLLYIVPHAIENYQRILQGLEPEEPIIISDPINNLKDFIEVEWKPRYVINLPKDIKSQSKILR